MKKVILILIVLLIAGGGFYYFRIKDKKTATEEQKPKVVEAQSGPMVNSVEASGSVASNLDVEIKCKASGEIISLPFDVSDTVKKGELVLELDPVDEERNVSKSQVTLNSSKARLSKSQKNLEISEQELVNNRKKAEITLETSKIRADEATSKEQRIKDLYEKKLVSREELDAAVTTATSARADLEKARIAIDELKTQEASLELTKQDVGLSKADVESAEINLVIAKQRLAETKVYAPIDGVITDRKVQTGQIITSATGNVSGGTAVMTISDLSRLYVHASVDESDIGNVRPGQEVKITADAFPEAQYRGVVDRIAPRGESVSNVVIFDVRIEVLKPGRQARPEMGAEASAGGTAPVGQPDKQERTSEGRKQRPEGTDGESFRAARRESGGGEMPQRPAGFVRSELKPGMTADVEIIIASKDEAVYLPSEALSRIKGKYYVTVVTVEEKNGEEAKTEDREVEVGITDGINTEIVSGLKVGEKVQLKKGAAESRWNRDQTRGMPPMMPMGRPR